MTDSNFENARNSEQLSSSSKRNISLMVELRDVTHDLNREINQLRDVFYKIHNSSQIISSEFSDDEFTDEDSLIAEQAVNDANHDSFSIQSDLLSAIARANESLSIIRNVKLNRETALEGLEKVR